MKIVILSVALLTFLSISSCENKTDLSSNHYIIKEDKIVDFSIGDNKEIFTCANGYQNPYPFNCVWTSDAISVEDGKLNITLFENNQTVFSGEYRSKRNEFHYGYYETRMKMARCSGTISSFFTYTNRPVWDEIDIEFLGKNFEQVQFNYYTNGVGGHEFLYNLGFDATMEFHNYGFDWQSDRISWFVDGELVHTATSDIPSHPQQIMANLWNCLGHDEWSGKFNPNDLPVKAQYEYIAYQPNK